jgi:hypothetical protein
MLQWRKVLCHSVVRLNMQLRKADPVFGLSQVDPAEIALGE